MSLLMVLLNEVAVSGAKDQIYSFEGVLAQW